MDRRDPRRENEPIIVGVRHDDRADEARAHAPARRPAKLLRARARLKLDPARARKILAEKMRGAGLDRLPVLDHRFDAERLHRAGKAFALGFLAAENRDREMIAHELFVNVEHLLGFRARFGFGFVDGVALLPEELGRAQKNARPHFPADHVGPLIDQNRQVAITLDPLRVARADDGFGGRPNDQWLGQRTGRHHFALGVYLEPAVSDDRAFLGEALHVRRFALEITERNEEREIGVPVAGRLEHRVELPLHVFPNAITPRTNDHAAAHVRWLRHFRRANRPADTIRENPHLAAA